MPSKLAFLRVTLVCAVLHLAAAAHAQPRPAEVIAAARRADALARAAQLTDAQARSVFAQLEPAPLSPTIRAVSVDARPDGSRNIFGLMDVDPRRECAIRGLPAGACGRDGTQTWVFFTQVSAAGEVEQTGFELSFAAAPRMASATRAVDLRLFAPSSPSEPRIALLDGVHTARQSYEHQLWIWDGRRGYGVLGARSLIELGPGSGGKKLMSVAVDEPGRRLVVTSLDCESGCRCTVPRAPADEAAQLARLVRAHPSACVPRERAFPFPRGLRLIDEDLDARAPSGAEAEVAAAVVPDLERASGLCRSQAEGVLARLRTAHLFAPHFSHFVTVPRADGGRTVFGIIETRLYDSCVVRRRDRSLYDAARACAWNDLGSNLFVAIELSPSGEVTDARTTELSGEPVAVHAARDSSGAVVPVVETLPSRTLVPSEHSFNHEAQLMRGSPADRAERISDAHFVGELVARPVGSGLVTLLHRRTACSTQCPCEPMPQSQAEEHALLDARARAADPRCAVEEAPLSFR